MRELSLPPATSASQLAAYVRCPRSYAFKYVLGLEPEFRSLNLVLGSLVHSVLGWFFEQKLAGRTPSQESVDRIVDADLLALTEGEPIRWKDATPENVASDTKRFVRCFLSEHADLPVKHIEQPFRVPLADPDTGEVLGRDLKGFFDLTLEDGTIIELKTSARGWQDHEVSRHLQLGAYAFAFNAMHGAPSKVRAIVVVKLKREPRIETFTVERGEHETRWWLEAAAAIEGAISGGHFPPNPNPFCVECEYARSCIGLVRALPLERPPAREDHDHHHLEVVQ
jgi:CRISPR/Cas system-associated exonuclease Cas4 (RecB family)